MKVLRWIARWKPTPWLILIGVAGLSWVCLGHVADLHSGRLKFSVDPSIKALLPRDGEALAVYETTRDRFTTDDYLLVAWLAEDIYTPERLTDLKRMTRRIERLPGVDKVESLASAYNLRARDDITEINAFLDKIPATVAEAEQVRDEARANPLYNGHLVSADGSGVLVVVHFDAALSSPQLIELVDQIAQISEQDANGIEQFLSGPLSVRLEVSRVMLRDLYRTMPLAVLATLIVALVGFQSVHGVLMPLVSNAVALLVALATFVLAGHTMNFVTVILPPVIYVVGFAYAIHVVSDFDRCMRFYEDKVTATFAAVKDVFVPLTLTAFTTALGFLSLTVSNIESIRIFGLYAALGTLLAWACALIVVPAGLMVLPARATHRRRVDVLSRIAPRLARFDIRHARIVIGFGAFIAVVSLLAATQIEVSTNYLRNFPEQSSIRVNFQKIGDVFTGAVPLQILIETDTVDAFKEPEQLRTVAALKSWLEEQPEIGGVYSLVDYIKVVHRALAPDEMTSDGIPKSASMTNHLMLLGGADDVYRFTTFDYDATLLHVRSSAISTEDLMALVARINQRLSQLPKPMRGQVTGSSYLVARTIEDITRGQVLSLALAMAVIFLVLTAMFGSLRAGAIALIPNALPIIAYFGILGSTSITLNLTTSLVASVVLGIAVDDSIHFLSRFSSEARRSKNNTEGAVSALTKVIRPVSFTTIALCFGFITLTIGELKSQFEFGLLAAAVLFIAWFLDVTFTPALCARMRFVTSWDLLTVPIGRAPHKNLSVFSGLSNRDARTAALAGEISGLSDLPQLSADADAVVTLLEDWSLPAAAANTGSPAYLAFQRGAILTDVHRRSLEGLDSSYSTKPFRALVFDHQAQNALERDYPKIAQVIARNVDSASE